jgi:hypothetical protein
MLRKLLSKWRKTNVDKVGARVGAFASRHKTIGRALVFAAGFSLVVLLIHREVYSFLTRRGPYAVPDIRTAVAPAWSDRQGVEIVRVDNPGANLFDETLVAKVGKAFEDCAWIQRVTSVERVFPDQLRVRFEYRRPRVAVRCENGYVVVDAEGVRLPGVYVDPPPCERSVQVAGVGGRPPEPGRAWDSPALKAGMALADYVDATPLLARLRVREINVANHGGRLDPRLSEVVLSTSSGVELAWGRTADTARFGDPTPEEKLENLREVLASYPDFSGLRRVKIYFRGARAVEPAEGHAQIRR